MIKCSLRRSASFMAAALMAAYAAAPGAFSAPSTVSAADTVLKYEFEDGKTSGGKLHTNGVSDVKLGDFPEDTDLTGFSGKGFAYLDQKGTTLNIEVDVPEAGLYELNICYCEPSDPRKRCSTSTSTAPIRARSPSPTPPHSRRPPAVW